MADNTSRAREQLEGHRRAVRDASRKWHRYTEAYEKDGQVKTAQNSQRHIAKLKEKHPILRRDTDRADSWRGGDPAL